MKFKKLWKKIRQIRFDNNTDYTRFRADKEENRNHKANKTIEYLHIFGEIKQ